jgi:hypothetical protein
MAAASDLVELGLQVQDRLRQGTRARRVIVARLSSSARIRNAEQVSSRSMRLRPDRRPQRSSGAVTRGWWSWFRAGVRDLFALRCTASKVRSASTGRRFDDLNLLLEQVPAQAGAVAAGSLDPDLVELPKSGQPPQVDAAGDDDACWCDGGRVSSRRDQARRWDGDRRDPLYEATAPGLRARGA